MVINEIFESISGEAGRAILQGSRVTFLRTFGCPLKCTWCDTERTLAGADNFEHLPIDLIVNKVRSFGNRRIIITGGEPAVQEGLPELLAALVPHMDKIVIETSGMLDISSYRNIQPSIISFVVDYKPPSAKIKVSHNNWNLRNLKSVDTLKFPVMDSKDMKAAVSVCNEVIDFCRKANRNTPLLAFSPVSGLKASYIMETLKEEKIDGLLSMQIHKVLGVE